MTSPPPDEPTVFEMCVPDSDLEGELTAELNNDGVVRICRDGVLIAAMSVETFQWFRAHAPPLLSCATPAAASSITDEELAFLEANHTCDECGHNMVFHDMEYNCCDIPGCRCVDGKLQPEQKPRPPLTGVAPVVQPGRVGSLNPIIRCSFDGMFDCED
ncbi:MAG: hypothetical protein JRD89_02405 [Deltaproteobacteria bacterium]|nr:hypothetical protein [Deltaproteobacteria bacterium]